MIARGLVSKGVLRAEERSGEETGEGSGTSCMKDEGGVRRGGEDDDDGELGLDGGDGGDGDRSGEGEGVLRRGTLAPLPLVLAMISVFLGFCLDEKMKKTE